MMMQVAAICFPDCDSGDEAAIVVRADSEGVGLTLSLRKGSDTEVFFGSRELDQLISALERSRGLLSRVKPVV